MLCLGLFAPENTALAFTAVASLFQKEKIKMFFISTVGRTENN